MRVESCTCESESPYENTTVCVQVQVSALASVTVESKTLRASMSPADEALNIPASLIVTAPDAVHCLTRLRVSFVAVVVVLDTVADALALPLAVFSVTSAVCVAAKAVVPEPFAKYVNAVQEPVLPTSPATSANPALVMPILISPITYDFSS